MKALVLPVALAMISLASLGRCIAAEPSVAWSGDGEMSQIALPLDRFSVADAVSLEGDVALAIVNDSTFEAYPNAVFDWKIPSGDATSHGSKGSGRFRVPEPTTIALFFAGVGTLLLFRRRSSRYV